MKKNDVVIATRNFALYNGEICKDAIYVVDGVSGDEQYIHIKRPERNDGLQSQNPQYVSNVRQEYFDALKN